MRNIESLISLPPRNLSPAIPVRLIDPSNWACSASSNKNSHLDLRVYIEFLISNEIVYRETRAMNGHAGCGVLSEREGWLECQQALETEFHLASLNIGWKRRGTHPSAAGSFVSRCGQQHRWHWRRKLPPGSGGAYATKRPIHRTSNKRTLPRDRYKGSIVYRIVRSINHRPKKSGDFLTYALSAPLRRRDAERITFLDRNDHYARSRKKDQILSTTN